MTGGGDEEPPHAQDHGEISLGSIPLHSTNLLTLLDPAGYVRYESPSIERIYGFDQDELVGEAVAEYFHPADRERVVQAFGRLVEDEQHTVETVEYRHEIADGSYLWVESAASSEPTPEGYYVINTRDISTRKRREQELERTNDRLDRYASVVSHDLKNPLNVASLRLDLLADECNSEHLDPIERAHDRIEALIEDVLTLTRSANAVEHPEWLALATVVDGCWETVPTGETRLVNDASGQIYADRSQLKQLFENLLGNAVQHGSADSPTVTVGELADGFYIADDGSGIAVDRREQVFDTGFSTSQNGTGLGLAIVREIATAHGWEVDVTDSDDGGAQIEVTGVDCR